MSSALLIAALWLAADPVGHEPAREVQSAARLKLMKETATRIEIHVKANEEAKAGAGRVAVAVARHGSHRSGRARIRASGSSTDRLAIHEWSPWLFGKFR